jgi:hypothetical protein
MLLAGVVDDDEEEEDEEEEVKEEREEAQEGPTEDMVSGGPNPVQGQCEPMVSESRVDLSDQIRIVQTYTRLL